MTRTSSPPLIGSGLTITGRSTQSELLPGACSVLDPSKPQIGGSWPSGTILVFDRSLAVGFCPSIQYVFRPVRHSSSFLVRPA